MRPANMDGLNFGESEADKDHMLLELERKCLEEHRPKVEEAANAKAHASIAEKEAEIATPMAEHLHQDFGTIVDMVIY